MEHLLTPLIEYVSSLPLHEMVSKINEVKIALHEVSPFKNEPVDCVVWVPSETVVANDYNPNSVAPPEMQLLEISIINDGYTQPIVTWQAEEKREVIDGFHRNRVGKESAIVKDRILGYLPVVTANKTDKGSRIASTIRHNRARGKHQVSAMSEIVIELKNRNWTNERIAKELGMDKDEVLRLMQITGLESLFKDEDFSKSWMIEDSDLEIEDFTDDISDEERESFGFRTVNTSDETRIFHTYDKWECFKAGFYNTTKPGMTQEQCEMEYCMLLSDDDQFRRALDGVISNWKYSCEHYLTNKSMNRIAWLGQASLCYAKGIPSVFRSGFNLLNEEQKERANRTAHEYLNIWLTRNGLDPVSFEEVLLIDKQAEIY